MQANQDNKAERVRNCVQVEPAVSEGGGGSVMVTQLIGPDPLQISAGQREAKNVLAIDVVEAFP